MILRRIGRPVLFFYPKSAFNAIRTAEIFADFRRAEEMLCIFLHAQKYRISLSEKQPVPFMRTGKTIRILEKEKRIGGRI